jgi:hypothetical protein
MRQIDYSKAKHAIWDAVEAALNEGASLERTLEEVRCCWVEVRQYQVTLAKREAKLGNKVRG